MSGAGKTLPEPKRDDPMIAAEYALGLLEGEELLNARGKVASDEDFAWRKDWWDNWFAPWTDEVAGMEPSDEVWDRISAEVSDAEKALESQPTLITESFLERAERKREEQRDWFKIGPQGWGLVAAVVAVFMVSIWPDSTDPGTDPDLIASADNYISADIPVGNANLTVSHIRGDKVIAINAMKLAADGFHDHELWLVPADGSELQSLGVIIPGEISTVQLAQDVANNIDTGVGLVLTREPIGGKPQGEEAGPVVAEGAFSTT